MCYNAVKSSLQKNKVKKMPPSPVTMSGVKAEFEREDIMQQFGFTNDEPRMPFYLGTVDTLSYGFTVFGSKKTLQLIQKLDERKYHIDGTFSIAPQGEFKQVLVIHIVVHGHVSCT